MGEIEFDECVMCGDRIDFCAGHGESGIVVWEAHDDGDHAFCVLNCA